MCLVEPLRGFLQERLVPFQQPPSASDFHFFKNPVLSMASVLGSLAIFQPISMRVSLSDPMRALSQALCRVLFEGGLMAPYYLSTAVTCGVCSALAYCLQVMSNECLRTAKVTSNYKGAMRGLPLFFCLIRGRRGGTVLLGKVLGLQYIALTGDSV